MALNIKYDNFAIKYDNSRGESMRKAIEQVDRETGEVLQGCIVWLPNKPKLTERWFMVFQDTLEAIAKDRDLTGENYRVLMYLFSKLDFENYIQQSQKEIAEGLGMRKENVSRAMKLLITKQIILEAPKISNIRCYRLNPNYGWKGKVKSLTNYRKDELKVVKGGKDN